jgi:hypothetical protein
MDVEGAGQWAVGSQLGGPAGSAAVLTGASADCGLGNVVPAVSISITWRTHCDGGGESHVWRRKGAGRTRVAVVCKHKHVEPWASRLIGHDCEAVEDPRIGFAGASAGVFEVAIPLVVRIVVR